jgi:beta-lactamase class A
MGLAALHLESGRSVYLNRGVSFPMASSYKVPMRWSCSPGWTGESGAWTR